HTSKEGKKYLTSLPVILEAVFTDPSFRLFMTHASPHSMTEYLDSREKIEHAFKDSRADVVIFGHTHKPRIEKIGNAIYINPGSVGEPRDGNADASYAILDTQTMEAKIERIAYDVNTVADRIMKHKLPEEIASIFRTGKVPWEDV
ncbi:metallophosphoesterase family protein, partial [Patescibacteria group bacterium]|nr:metallophosphoesterase family protein [Patescibacteria group bacterium]